MPLKIPTNKLPREPAMKLMAASSRRRGMTRAPANGQPMIAPRPNHIMPCAVFWRPLQSRKDARPSIEVYMVKLDGKKAAEA
jgi:hypothetical protein